MADEARFVHPWRWRTVRGIGSCDVGYCRVEVGAGWNLAGWLACETVRIVLVGKGWKNKEENFKFTTNSFETQVIVCFD